MSKNPVMGWSDVVCGNGRQKKDKSKVHLRPPIGLGLKNTMWRLKGPSSTTRFRYPNKNRVERLSLSSLWLNIQPTFSIAN